MAVTCGIINGSDFLVYVEGVAIAHATSHSLNVTQATRDATTKDNLGWRSKLSGMREWSCTADGLISLDQSAILGTTDLFTLMTNRTTVTVKFATDNSGDAYWGGEAILSSLNLDAPMEENGTYSATFEGVSSLVEYTVT